MNPRKDLIIIKTANHLQWGLEEEGIQFSGERENIDVQKEGAEK